MSNTNDNQNDDRNKRDSETKMSEAQIAEILQRVGPRGKPSEAISASIKANVRVAWQEEVVAAANLQKSRRRMAIAASVAVIAGAGYFFTPTPTADAVEVASASQVIGTVEYRAANNQNWNNLTVNMSLTEDTEVRAAEDSYAAISLGNGMNLRIDEGTGFSLTSSGEVFLSRGGLYAESNDESSIVIRTPFGQAEDIGTEFEVRVQPNGWQVQVREGLVSVANPASQKTAKAGERIVIAQDQTMQRQLVSSSDESWQWTHQVHEPFELEGASLSQYLSWWSDETGRNIAFANDEDLAAAQNTILHGSMGNVSVADSLKVVLSTTRFEVVDSTSDQVILSR